MEFHIARSLRERLGLDEAIFSYNGNVVFANVAEARKLAAGLNALRGKDMEGFAPANGGAIFAMGLIDEFSHAMVDHYRKNVDAAVLTEALRWFEQSLGTEKINRLLLAFAERFPGTAVIRGEVTAQEWLKRTTEGLPHRESELEELMMLWLANQNPAFQPFRELFADEELKTQTAYPNLTAGLPDYFVTRPPLSKEAGSLIEALRAPMLASPDSLIGQLDFMRENWKPFIGDLLERALLAIDIVREEDLAIWMRFHPPSGRGPQHGEHGWEAHGFTGDEYVGYDQDFEIGPDGRRRARRYASDHQAPLVEYEAFSQDQAWMPTVVMMAKSTYVWLEQLSKKYLRHIYRLDQIPDEELRYLADRGMTALWLIGLWERSVASRTIKRLRGQADAVASAYSLKEYNIAEDLGGNEAYERLRDRAAHFGLRLASDMVPNHMGIDSVWVIEHPEWFITRPDPPFPVYTYNGPDLSMDSRAEIKIEDHYYDQTDAAVAFRLRTYRDNQTRYMYHGNDGTTFAWNDTAQLDYSKAEVREHIIQTILHVARLFPIIRFDAAMVLAKRHVQRLWFPLPGVGGSIPSRAENAMSQEQFDELMPHEFWREVVDRVAVEVPGTLLLAEAFWLLEGYFVRTLGMHRVYNSAFMNMLRDEENAKYRSYLKKTLEFDPDILKRYVNFMSNPDEKTAAEQFGSGDKHFGTCTLLATLPGLPMFAHGQVEGFVERYGMDFKEARMQETPDEGLMARYHREITPLLRNRRLFTESTNFVLYDFWTDYGSVDENVIAYSNRLGNERAVILYNNVYGSTWGTIKTSVAAVDKGSGRLRHRTLIDALALPTDNDVFVAYRESNHGVEYLRRCSDLRDHGLSVPMRGYQYLVLQDWRELRASHEQPWDQLCDSLNGAGVPNLWEALSTLRLRPAHDALRALISPANVRKFIDAVHAAPAVAVEEQKTQATKTPEQVEVVAEEPVAVELAEAVEQSDAFAWLIPAGERFYTQAAKMFSLPETAHAQGSAEPSKYAYADRLREIANLFALSSVRRAASSPAAPSAAGEEPIKAGDAPIPLSEGASVLAWIVLESLPDTVDKAAFFDELRLRSASAEIFSGIGLEGEDSWRAAARVRLALMPDATVLERIRSDAFWNEGDAQWLIGISEANNTTYFDKGRFEALLRWLHTVDLARPAEPDGAKMEEIFELAASAGYKVKEFRRLVEENKRLASEPQTTLPS